MLEPNEEKGQRNHESPDPTADETTNLRDDGSMEERTIEAETPGEERPDAHVGNVPGEVDPRMAQAAADIQEDHAGTQSPSAIDEPGLDKLNSEEKAEHTEE